MSVMEHKDVSEVLQTRATRSRSSGSSVTRSSGTASPSSRRHTLPAAAVVAEARARTPRASTGADPVEDSASALARPVVYVIEGEQVRWRPAIDVNRIVLGLLVLVGVALVTRGAVEKARRAAPRRRWSR